MMSVEVAACFFRLHSQHDLGDLECFDRRENQESSSQSQQVRGGSREGCNINKGELKVYIKIILLVFLK